MTKRKATNVEGEDGNGPKVTTGDELIRMLNGLSSGRFQQTFIKDHHLEFPGNQPANQGNISLQFKTSSEMTKDELNACFNLVESTSRPDYENSGWGWHPRRKRREMKEEEMRYLLVKSVQSGRLRALEDGGEIQGFLSFMLTHDSSPSVPVLYVYEIHLMSQLRRLGLGAHLMQVAEDVAGEVGVEKVMLTCFVCNEKAYSFYERRGYGKDVVSPEDRKTRQKVMKADYAILSKASRISVRSCRLSEHRQMRMGSDDCKSTAQLEIDS